MSLRSLLKDASLLRIPFLQPSLESYIKTDSSQRKGKISVVKRKFAPEEKSFEILEVKDTSSVMKRLNWENNQLFGEIVSAARRCYYKTQYAFSGKNICKLRSDSPAMVDDDTAIPIQNIAPEILIKNGISLVSDPLVENRKILLQILDFPLTNVIPKGTKNDSYILQLNHLRQHLSSLCKQNYFPSVTAILEKTMPPERAAALAKWKSDMINKMGEENFKKYQEELMGNGASFHNNISMYLSGVPESRLDIKEANRGCWESLKDFLPSVKEVRFLEEHISHQFLCYRGVADCFGRYKKSFVVIDWKTSKKLKPTLRSTFDNPLQLAAYAGAMNFDQNWSYLANTGLIAIAYSDGTPATMHYLDENTMMHYWNLWLKRLKSYWESIENPIQHDLLDKENFSECAEDSLDSKQDARNEVAHL